MALTSVTIPPGVVSTPTKTSRSTNWQEVNLIRWSAGKMMPVGGWEKLAFPAFPSRVRAIHTWTTLSGLDYTAYFCEQHCFVSAGNQLYDISPAVPLAPPSTTTAGGWGDNDYSFDMYGTERPARDDIKPLTPGFYIDNWGQNLVIMSSEDGRLLMWDPSDINNVLEPVAGAPLSNRAFVVTPQRHVILFSAGGVKNRFAWCSQEDISDWNYASVTNTAGFLDFQPMASIISACKSGNDVVFWTSSGAIFGIRYIGVPYVFSFEQIGQGPVPVSPASVYDSPLGCVWISTNGPWRYEAGSVVPVACEVWPWVIKNADPIAARFNAAMVALDTFSELWWFFPCPDDEGNCRYIQWNYKEGWWSQGKLKRSCGASSTYTQYPLMSDGSFVYRHESGRYHGTQGENDLPWAKSFNLNINVGLLGTFNRLLPDIDGDIESLAFQLEYNIPRAGNLLRNQLTPERKMLPSGFVPFRHTGRDFRIIAKQVTHGAPPWTWGDTGADIIPRGDK